MGALVVVGSGDEGEMILLETWPGITVSAIEIV